MSSLFPFPAIVGQEEMKKALLAVAVDQSIGGVLLFGDRGTGKSTSIRALAAMLPKIRVWKDSPYNCDGDKPSEYVDAPKRLTAAQRRALTREVTVPVVDLPLGATEDRVVGALDIEKALSAGEKAFEPGLLAKANRGFLYIDEVNLLEDHIVDLLLDVAASGENLVEREGLSVRHPAKFVLVGSGNPEEGELRPQLLDRFGLVINVVSPDNIEDRVEVLKRRDEFEQNPDKFLKKWASRSSRLRSQVKKARAKIATLKFSDDVLAWCAGLCLHLGCDGSRGEITLARTARALAALRNAKKIEEKDLTAAAVMALGHRLRRDPLDETSAQARVMRALSEISL